ncbi:hypothetical protein FRC09_008229 [Ceratobasidium sp. 395]|nr:hypothetical protein FRC09_008229 [Ceratobasidium sp. 395]
MGSRSAVDMFNAWQAAHDNLIQAAQTFLGTSKTLLQFIDESPDGLGRHGPIEDGLLSVYRQIQNIPVAEKRIRESQFILRKIVNVSATLMPINTLPPEILSHIFSLLTSSATCVDDKRYRSTKYYHGPRCYHLYPLVAIPAVCSRWRHLAVSTPSFWSHIDVDQQATGKNRENVLPRTRLWLERARDAPISLHIGAITEVSGHGWELLCLLEPYMTNLISLKFYSHGGAYFWPILNLYAKARSLGSESVVHLALKGAWGLDFISGPFTWPVNAFRGLGSLQMNNLEKERCPNMDDLVALLVNSPTLHTLRLKWIRFATSGGHSYPKIVLSCLRQLQLAYLDDSTLPVLLSILEPGQQELHAQLLLEYRATRESCAAVLSFLKRTNITCLSLSGIPPDGAAQLAKQLSCVPQLRMLELRYARDEEWINMDALLSIIKKNKFRARCPNLQLLWVNGGIANSEAYIEMRRIILHYRLSTIVFEDRRETLRESKQKVTEWLRQRVKNVISNPKRKFRSFEGRERDLYLQ